ncbi:hypothetical protein CLIM01_07261 [Colletotrichum limetticola]|uniref:Zn(2)-C6 fungal-type domain-containing protein n=1 Tax=Colletotrichum limetticola TaxID=1209924 RepID=A0ABQ9PUZ3_9PEZI|nr:hypothetical protein CLIM01_07261 [Colletotrichum limetticola]
MTRTPRGRSAVACKACHTQKLKCNGGAPCERCQTRGRPCVYPVREKYITVPQSYLRRLERQPAVAQRSGDTISSPESVRTDSNDFATPLSPKSSQTIKEEELEDCSAEFFVKRLRQRAESYTYSRLKFDFLQSEVSFRLPPRPYAFHLLQAFDEGFSEYHWFLRKRFRERILLTYSDPQSQSHDRNWLCRVSVVLALAESWNRSRMSSAVHMEIAGKHPTSPPQKDAVVPLALSPHSQSTSQTLPPPPGSEFFEQGLMLLKMSAEEPVPEDVEALCLIAFYCYSLNRRKTAYSYASQSVALAKLLHLHKPHPLPKAPDQQRQVRVMNEHRKRLWWTSYCMDRMISTELGVAAAVACVPEGMQLPSSAGLDAEDLEEFSDPGLLTMQTQLCEIKRNVVRTAAQHVDVDDERRLEIIKPCLDTLKEWRTSLPQQVAFTFEESLPTRLMEAPHGRILASTYMRYHQCFILLLRPLYLQRLSSIVQKRRLNNPPGFTGFDTPLDTTDPMRAVKIQCLQAARNNCKILLGLWNYDKIAKFGYWESLHLFSGLAILALARVSIEEGKDFNPNSEDDMALYTRTRALLREMARVGNPAAKDHDVLLSDVEAMVKRISREEETIPRQSSVEETDRNVEMETGLSFSDCMFSDVGADQQIWSDKDWESILSTYTQGI